MTTEINQEQIDWLLTQAYTKMSHKQYDDSLAILKGLVVLAPDSHDGYRMLAYTLLQANQPEESLKMVDKYLQHLPSAADDEEIHWIKGRAKLRLKKAATTPPKK
ncbi:MAG: hypothetical protein KAG53_05830 [Endozoicomonadaceae bacterium]|nr:hypothetical protein [Endozoicomonadaceae bacterium]